MQYVSYNYQKNCRYFNHVVILVRINVNNVIIQESYF